MVYLIYLNHESIDDIMSYKLEMGMSNPEINIPKSPRFGHTSERYSSYVPSGNYPDKSLDGP